MADDRWPMADFIVEQKNNNGIYYQQGINVFIRPSTIGHRPSAIDQRSTINGQRPSVNAQRSTANASSRRVSPENKRRSCQFLHHLSASDLQSYDTRVSS
jgi:hypothetical protein